MRIKIEIMELILHTPVTGVSYPYPKVHEKERLSYQTGLSIKKVENWFINERSRKWHLYRKKF